MIAGDQLGEKYFGLGKSKPLLSHYNIKKKTFPRTYSVNMFQNFIQTLKSAVRMHLSNFRQTETYRMHIDIGLRKENFDYILTNEQRQNRFLAYLIKVERAVLFGFFISVKKFKQTETHNAKPSMEAILDIDKRFLGILEGRKHGSFLWEPLLRKDFKDKIDKGNVSFDIFDVMMEYIYVDLQHLYHDYCRSDRGGKKSVSVAVQ